MEINMINRSDDVFYMSIAQEIKEMIIRDQMNPGDRLPTEKELMAQFGISRSTLRESMKVLKAENVVVSRQGSGTFISKGTGIGEDPLGLRFANQNNLLSNLLETRLLIEPEVAGLAALRATDDDIRKLKATVEEMEKHQFNDTAAEEMDIRFHTAVAECTHNDVLIRVIPIINESIRRGHEATQFDSNSFRRAKTSHRGIFNAISRKNFLEAKFIMEHHIWGTRNDIEIKEERS